MSLSTFPDLKTHFNTLLSLPSVSSANSNIDTSNKSVIDYLAQCFTDLGFSCEIVESPSDSSEKKFNLVATLGTGDQGLVLSGHTDTVPLNEELWSMNPFQLTEKDDRFYGLGSTDMKGFFAVAIEAVKEYSAADFKQPLIILATADEETSMYGARHLAELGIPKARRAVIGEPTGMVPVRTHKGMMMESIRLVGQSGHSSDPGLGRNAMEGMHEVINELITYRKELKVRYQNDLFQIPHPTLNLGCIHGGDNPNRICGHCELQYDIRLMPGMHIDEVREAIRVRAQRVAKMFNLDFELVPLFPGIPSYFAEENSELLAAAERLTGNQAISVAFGTEAPHLQSLGLDTIVMGPGNIDQAHQPDEYMSMDMINPCIKVLKQLIEESCINV